MFMFEGRPLEIIKIKTGGSIAIPENVWRAADIKDEGFFAVYVESDSDKVRIILESINLPKNRSSSANL